MPSGPFEQSWGPIPYKGLAGSNAVQAYSFCPNLPIIYRMNINFITCLAGIVLWAAVISIMLSKISREKKILTAAGKATPKTETSFGASLCLTLLVELLPFIIPMKYFAEVISCICGILGAYIVLKERLDNIKKAQNPGE